MSSDVHSSTAGMTTQASVSGSPVAGPPTTLPSPTASAQAPGLSSIAPTVSTSNASDSVQESVPAKLVNSPSYVSTASSFSYGVVSKAIATSGSSQQTSSTPVMKSSAPASLQPPVPGLSSATGPSFSYNVSTNNNVGSLSGQQFHSSNVVGSGLSQDGKSTPPIAVASLQPPIPGKPGVSNLSISGTPGQMAIPIHSPVPVPKGASSIAAGFSFSRPPQSPTAADASLTKASSTSNTSATMSQEAGTSTPAPSSSQTAPLPSSHSSMNAPAHPNLFQTSIWMSTTPSFNGSPGMLVPPGIQPVASFSSTGVVRPTTPVMPTTASLPSNPAVQRQMYPFHPSLPAMVPPQVHWLQPPQVAGMQRPTYQPYPNVLPNPFPVPMHGMVLPSVSDSQPPGVSSIGPFGGTPYAVGSGQPASGSVTQPELPPPGTDHGKSAVGVGKVVNNEETDAWTAHKTDTGAVYYYNAVTGESTYEKPSGFKGELDKVTVQSNPMSTEKVAGTDWILVNTEDGKKYYYHSVTKISSWQIPVELTELRKKQDSDPLKTNNMDSAIPEKGSGFVTLSTPAISTGGRDASALRPSSGPSSSSALDLIKKKLQDSGIPVTSSPPATSSGPPTSDINGSKDATLKGLQGENSKDKQKGANGDQNMSDSSSDSEDVDSGPTKEECIIQFKEMLKERGVAPFSKWEKELPKIVFDPRFKAVPGYSTRRSLFEHYVRTRAEEERKEKRAAQKAATEGFKQLLEEVSEDIDHKTDYHSFKRKWGSDPRFEALDRKERETLLNERVLLLKKAAEEKIQAIRAAAASDFKSMLREKGDISTSSRWSRVKDSLRNDPRYRSVKHEDREVLFNEYISELKTAEEDTHRAEKLKRDEKDKLKERERETRKRKEREEQEMERVRLKVRRKEAISSYQALLMETIKDPQASWTESKPKLEKDPQGRATNSDLDQADTEKLFREHVKMLYDRCAREFQVLLADVITAEAASHVSEDGKSVLTSWSTAKSLLKSDARYSKMPRKDRESLWRRYADDLQRKQKLASDPVEDKLNTEVKNRSSHEFGRSPARSRRIHGRR